jgi:hypothetical protein
MKTRRGSTLFELLVVGTMFLSMLTALWMIYDSTITVERNITLKVDVDREIFAAARNLDAALKTSRLTRPADWYDPQLVESVELTPLSLDTSGQPVINPQGIPQFGAPFTIAFQNGELVRPDTKRRLARLGSNGQVKFIRSGLGMLEMRLRIEKTGYRGQTTSRQLAFQFCLYNQ